MKQTIQILLISTLGIMSSIAQNQKGTSPPVTDPDLIEMNTFLRNDAYIRPYSSDEIQRFCDYIKENPITKEVKIKALQKNLWANFGSGSFPSV